MSSQNEPGPAIRVTRHPQGLTIKITERDPERRYLPVDPRVVRRALAETGDAKPKGH